MRQFSNTFQNPHSDSSQTLSQTPVLKTTFIAEGAEIDIENQYVMKSPYIKSFQEKVGFNEELRIILPKWVSIESLQIILYYLKTAKIDPTINYGNTNLIQKLLWLSDFLQLEEFQKLFLNEKMIPKINCQNTLMLLSESFKKLRIAEDSSEIWYLLFNTSMNHVAKNLVWLIENKRSELLDINEKILEEIIERALKYSMQTNGTGFKEIIELFIQIQKTQDPIECLGRQLEKVVAKPLCNSGSPNITWKLKRLSQIVEKETSLFRFGGFSWKLVAKTKPVENGKKQIEFYLKFENTVPATSSRESNASVTRTNTEQNQSDAGLQKVNGIFSIAFQIKANGQNLNTKTMLKSFQTEKSSLVFLHRFILGEDARIKEDDNEFIVYLNLEYGYSSMLTYISRNLEKFTKSNKIGQLQGNDVAAILNNLESNSQLWAHGFELALRWWSMTRNLSPSNLTEVFNALHWPSIQLQDLLSLRESKILQSYECLNQKLESEITKKTSLVNTQGVSSMKTLPKPYAQDSRNIFDKSDNPKFSLGMGRNDPFLTNLKSEHETSYSSISSVKYTEMMTQNHNIDTSSLIDGLDKLSELKNGLKSIDQNSLMSLQPEGIERDSQFVENRKLNESQLTIPPEEFGGVGLNEKLASANKPKPVSVSLAQLSPKANVDSASKLPVGNDKPIATSPFLTSPLPKSHKNNSIFSRKPAPSNLPLSDNLDPLIAIQPATAKNNFNPVNPMMTTQSSKELTELLSPQTNASRTVRSPKSESVIEFEFTKSPMYQPPNKLKMIRSGSSKHSLQNLKSVRENSTERCFTKPIANTNQVGGAINSIGEDPSSMCSDQQNSYDSNQAGQALKTKLSDRMNFKNAVKALNNTSNDNSQNISLPLNSSLNKEYVPLTTYTNTIESEVVLDGSQLPRNPLRKRKCSSENKTSGNLRPNLQAFQGVTRALAPEFMSPKGKGSNPNMDRVQSSEEKMLREVSSNPYRGNELSSLCSSASKTMLPYTKPVKETVIGPEIIDVGKYAYFIARMGLAKEARNAIIENKMVEDLKIRKEEILNRINPKQFNRPGRNLF